MFAKRHYETIATAMQAAHPGDHAGKPRLEAWHDCKRELAQAFRADSARFNYERFIVACLPGHNVKARTAYLKAAP
jgi:hypothetical protein